MIQRKRGKKEKENSTIKKKTCINNNNNKNNLQLYLEILNKLKLSMNYNKNFI
jgi:hypothetical protein